MELRDLEYFAVIAEHAHLGRAADALGLSQPALSKSLRRLEKSARAKLVARTPRGVALTAEGEALLSHARRLRLSLDDVAREIADVHRGSVGRIRIGLAPNLAEEYLAIAYSRLLPHADRLVLSIMPSGTSSMLAALRNGELDFVLGTLPGSACDDLEQVFIADDPWVPYASASHALAQRKQLTIQDLAGERWALTAPWSPAWQWLHRAFQDRGLPPPKIAIEANAGDLKILTIGRSNLLGFASDYFIARAPRSLKFRRLLVKDLTWHRQIGVCYRKGAYLPPAARRLIEELKATAKTVSD